ncbi:Os12g0110800 [Oryza sativa Japonica Group]|uniref:Os12g0110800 protein n=1 Tax=Oryza sativa subsp. japonica TaxID=39947 RepID=A0A0P0Y609_ORYSJ|nr:Os12g0110800 [Oryza sativa Japonica Group]
MAAGGEGLLPASFPFSSLPRCNRRLAEEEQDDADLPSSFLELLADAHGHPPSSSSTAQLAEAHHNNSISRTGLADGVRKLTPNGLELLATVDVMRERAEYLCSLVISNKVENTSPCGVSTSIASHRIACPEDWIGLQYASKS